MSEKILAVLVQFITQIIDAGGYGGIVALMGIESACIPLPSEVIMPFAGVLTIFHHTGLNQLIAPGRFGGGNVWLGLILVATAGALGCNLGSLVAYWIGAWGGRPLVERYGKWVLMSHHDPLFREVRFDHGAGGALVAGGAHVHRISGGDRKDATTALPHIYFRRLMAVVFRTGLRGDEAGRKVAYRSQVL